MPASCCLDCLISTHEYPCTSCLSCLSRIWQHWAKHKASVPATEHACNHVRLVLAQVSVGTGYLQPRVWSNNAWNVDGIGKVQPSPD